jgi:electron transport complex protein RnfA
MNFIFPHFIGLDFYYQTGEKWKSALPLGFAFIILMIFSMAANYPLIYLFLIGYDLEWFLRAAVFIIVSSGLIFLIGFMVKKLLPKLYEIFGKYQLFFVLNTALFGSVYIGINDHAPLLEMLIYILASGSCLITLLLMMGGIKERIGRAKMPKVFQGLPIAIISAALMAMAARGFLEMVK